MSAVTAQMVYLSQASYTLRRKVMHGLHFFEQLVRNETQDMGWLLFCVNADDVACIYSDKLLQRLDTSPVLRNKPKQLLTSMNDAAENYGGKVLPVCKSRQFFKNNFEQVAATSHFSLYCCGKHLPFVWKTFIPTTAGSTERGLICC